MIFGSGNDCAKSASERVVGMISVSFSCCGGGGGTGIAVGGRVTEGGGGGIGATGI